MTNEMKSENQRNLQQTIVIKKESNSIGTAGFVLSLITIFLGWIPVLGWIMWLLGLIFSFIGIFRKPRGLAIAGLIISLIGVIILLIIFGSLAGLAVMS